MEDKYKMGDKTKYAVWTKGYWMAMENWIKKDDQIAEPFQFACGCITDHENFLRALEENKTFYSGEEYDEG